jgi:hypothetical protein
VIIAVIPSGISENRLFMPQKGCLFIDQVVNLFPQKINQGDADNIPES